MDEKLRSRFRTIWPAASCCIANLRAGPSKLGKEANKAKKPTDLTGTRLGRVRQNLIVQHNLQKNAFCWFQRV
jgi:hypothetical protein